MMTQLFALDLTPCQQGQWRELLPLLSPERQQRVLSCRLDTDRGRIAGAGWLLRQALARCGVPVQQQVFSKNPWGKPQLVSVPQVHFSLSHSGNWAVCAVGDHPLGVDAELPRCSFAVAKRFFHPEEVAAAVDADSLCRLWTAKEAFVKALGTGLTVPLDSFVVHLDPVRLEQTLSELPYRLHEYRLPPCRVCLCSTDSRPELTVLT